MSKSKRVVDQIADVVGNTTKYYEYKPEFQDPLALAGWVEKRETEMLTLLLQRFNDYDTPITMTAEEVRDIIIELFD